MKKNMFFKFYGKLERIFAGGLMFPMVSSLHLYGLSIILCQEFTLMLTLIRSMSAEGVLIRFLPYNVILATLSLTVLSGKKPVRHSTSR